MTYKILITGAAGFIGSNLAEALLDSGSRVLAIDNFDAFYSRSIKEANISAAMGNEHYLFREGDIRDGAFIDDCISGFKPDIVIHLAAKAGVRPSLLDPESYFDVNVIGTLKILEMMKKNRVGKLIFSSSSSVYGNNEKIPFSEEDNVNNPISAYAASKKAGELLCHTYHHLYNMDIFCLRFFTVYGPRQRPDLAIHKFTKALMNNSKITIYGDGTTSRDYTYITDIVSGILKSVEKVSGFEVINLGGATPVKLLSLISLLERYTGENAKINFLPMQAGDVLQTYADIRKAKTLLDYCPVMDIESGIREFITWYKKDKTGWK